MTHVEMPRTRSGAMPPLDDAREREFERVRFRMGFWSVNELRSRAGSQLDALTTVLNDIAQEHVNDSD